MGGVDGEGYVTSRRAALTLLCCLAVSGKAQAASYPARPVRIIVPYSAGGATDVIGRMLGQSLSESFGETLLVDNRAGANGMLGTQLVATTEADGYTLLVVASSHPILGILYPHIAYDPIRDFAAISLIASTPYLLVVPPNSPAHTFEEFVGYAKKHPGKLTYASAGVGTSQHLGMELLKHLAGLDMLHVPYKGSGAPRADLLAGRVDAMLDNVAVMLPLVRSGKLRALAVSSRARTPLAPDVPTIAEAGLPEFEIEGWFGLLGRSGIPRPIVSKLNTAVNAALRSSEIINHLEPLGAVPLGGAPEEFGAFMVAERTKWSAIIKQANIRTE